MKLKLKIGLRKQLCCLKNQPIVYTEERTEFTSIILEFKKGEIFRFTSTAVIIRIGIDRQTRLISIWIIHTDAWPHYFDLNIRFTARCFKLLINSINCCLMVDDFIIKYGIIFHFVRLYTVIHFQQALIDSDKPEYGTYLMFKKNGTSLKRLIPYSAYII